MSNVTGFSNTQKIKEEAAMWLLKIEEEAPLSSDNIEALRQWVSTSETHRSVIGRMSKTWGEMDVLTVMMEPQVQRKWSAWDLLRTWMLSPFLALLYLIDKALKPLSILSRPAIAACLSLSLSVAIGLWFFGSFQTTVAPNVYKTLIGQQTHHVLSDGSGLWLNSNSEVEVIYNESHRRIRLLQGEVYFDVKKDATRPFEVYSGTRLVRAVGTAFSVYRLDDSIKVFVSEGKVELAIVDETLVLKPDDHPAKEGVPLSYQNGDLTVASKSPVTTYIAALEAGQSISIPTEGDAVVLPEVEDSIVQHDAGEVIRKLSWLDGKLVFAGEPLEQVVEEISRHTSMRIDVTDPILREMRIGGHFQAGDTDALFFVLESGFGIHVNKLNENHVELQAKK